MPISQFIPSLAAAAAACGLVLLTLSLWNKSGLFISVWLGLIAAVIVGVALAVIVLLLRFSPGGLSVLLFTGGNLLSSLAVWVPIAVGVLFVANGLSRPDRIFDVSFFVPMGLMYGTAAGVAYWYFSGARGA
jgi:hypothetical protein